MSQPAPRPPRTRRPRDFGLFSLTFGVLVAVLGVLMTLFGLDQPIAWEVVWAGIPVTLVALGSVGLVVRRR